MKDELTSERLFLCMCRFSEDIMNFTDLISIPAIAQHFGVTKYRVRKLMNELRDMGLVKSGYESCYSDWCEQFFIVRGFCITEKGRNTDTYKKVQKEEIALIEECFGNKEAE